MKEAEMERIGHWIGDALEHVGDKGVVMRIRAQVGELAAQFPLYSARLEVTAAARPR